MKKDGNEDLKAIQFILHKEILSFREALLYLDVSESLLYQLTSQKKIEFSKPNGGKVYFKKANLDKWMLQNESTSPRVLEEKILKNIKKDGKISN